MSVIGYPEAMNNKSDLQIWNNAAFDNGDSEDSNLIKSSWSPLKPIFVNPSDSLDSFSSKENRSPGFVKSPVSAKSPALVPVRPLHPNGAIGNSQTKPLKPLSKQGLVEKAVSNNEKKIDEEIEEIENEISRLSSRLEALRLLKAERNSKILEKQKRVLPVKFVEQKQCVKNRDGVKKIEETLSSSARSKIRRRGFSMGPTEIMSAAKFQQLGKQEISQITPFQAIQSRRKSCFWKLQDIEEEKVSKERGKSLRQVVTTVGLKKGVKKEDSVLTSIQPKKLFMKDGEKSVPAKKTLKPGRVIASRYNQSTANSAMRKRSLPENDMDESKRCDKKRASSVGKSRGTESRVKKRWEIPSEIVVPKKLELEENSPLTVSVVRDMLPRIRAVQCTNETPRDSGPAKRVAELIGRKTYFCNDEEIEPSVCQALSFVEEFEEEN